VGKPSRCAQQSLRCTHYQPNVTNLRKMILKGKLDTADAKTKQYREYFWGGWDQYRVNLAMGRDLQLNPRQHGSPLNTFGYPYAQIGSKTLD